MWKLLPPAHSRSIWQDNNRPLRTFGEVSRVSPRTLHLNSRLAHYVVGQPVRSTLLVLRFWIVDMLLDCRKKGLCTKKKNKCQTKLYNSSSSSTNKTHRSTHLIGLLGRYSTEPNLWGVD